MSAPTNARDTRTACHAVAVIGAGYVGLPTAATLAHFGHSVVLAEREPSRLAALRSGRMPIVEAGLDELVAGGVTAGRLSFTSSAVEAVKGAAFVFLCVPTPQSTDGSADLSYVETAAKEIATHLESGAVVVNKSTVPVGSATMVEQVIGRADISVVSNPEFLREGTAVLDSLNPDRIVVGASDPQAAAKVGELFSSHRAPLIVTDTTTSETIKYASNAFLATKLSFVNALAGLCEEVGADSRDVLLGLGYDKRIGFDFLRPGPGWGGSCLPKDTRALLHIARGVGYEFALARRRHRLQRRAAPAWSPRSRRPAAERSMGSRWPCGDSPSRRTPTTAATHRAWRSRTVSPRWVRPSRPSTPRLRPSRTPRYPTTCWDCTCERIPTTR